MEIPTIEGVEHIQQQQQQQQDTDYQQENSNGPESETRQNILITLVSQEPAIFNSKHEDYRNTAKKDELWTAMSKQVGWTDTYCKNKWKAIRDQYCRELKRARLNSNAVIKWKYFKHLEFLRPYALARNYRTKVKKEQDTDNEFSYQEDSCTTHESSLKTSEISPNDIQPTIKTEDWSMCESSDLLNDPNDITSEIMMQLSEPSQSSSSIKGETNGLLQEPQDDDDDDDDDDDEDPIHKYLNIESYFEKQLITQVQKNTVLYNSSHIFYRNTKAKLKIWEEIARKLNKTERQCRLKWKALRDQFMREYKRLRNFGFCTTIPRWKYYDDMAFLEQFVKERSECSIKAKKNSSSSSKTPAQDFEHEEMMNLPNNNDSVNSTYRAANENEKYNPMGDEDTSEIYTEHIYSPKQSTQEQPQQSEVPNRSEQLNHLEIEQVTEVTEAQSSSNSDENDDEVGSFFKAVAIKVRKANMSAVALTDLQIDILKVITNALKN